MRPGGAAAAAVLALAAALTAAVLAVAGTVLPAGLLTAQPAVASTVSVNQAAHTSQAGQTCQVRASACVTITGMSPQWASPGQTITVRGTLTNSTSEPLSDPSVLLLSSDVAFGSVSQMQEFATDPLVATGLIQQGAPWQAKTTLRPGQSLNWLIRLKVNGIGMTAFGVYPLAAQLDDQSGNALATAQSYLPYEPAKKGAGSSTRPAQRQIAWAWPLIDSPMLGEPWQNDCTGPQAQALATSLRSGGRLANLVSVGVGGAGSLAGRDAVTWTIDPALLLNAQALADCGKSNPSGARAATSWLNDLRSAVTGQPLSFTPYADIDVAALIQGDDSDVKRAFSLGRKQAYKILHVRHPASQVTGIDWSADGIAGPGMVESLAANDGVSTLLLDSSAMPTARRSVVQVPSVSGFMPVLLASHALTEALSSASGAAGSAFSSTQLFLAETAELAAADPAQPIIVAPPRRWQPSEGVATTLLQETREAPWLRPTSLPAVAAVKNAPKMHAPGGHPRVFSRAMRKEFRQVSRQIWKIWSYQAVRNTGLWYALAALESSAWTSQPGTGKRGTSKPGNFAQAEYRTVEKYIKTVTGSSEVEIVATSRDTLGGLRGYVPVSIYNRLGYAVRVKLRITPSPSDSNDFSVQQYPQRPIIVGKNSQQQVKLRVQASQVGSGKVTVQLTNPMGTPLPGDPKTITIQATQFGTLAMIILAVALGIFLLASAARALRRGRVRPTAEPSEAQPDNVVAERTGLDTAGKSRL